MSLPSDSNPRRHIKSGPDSTAIAAILVVMDRLSLQLKDIAQDVENSVNGVCEGFQGMGLRARSALTTAADALDTSCDGGGLQSFVHRVGMSLEIMLQRIESSRDFSALLSHEIEDIDDRFSAVLALGARLTSVAETAKWATFKGRTALSSPGSHKPQWEDLVEQTSVLSQEAASTGQAISSMVSGLSSAMKRASSRARNKAAEDADATSNTEDSVRNMLDQLSASYEKMTHSLSNSAAMSRQLNLDIGQAVMSMQFQDRVNQRIGHLVDSIEELMHELQPYTASADVELAQSLTQLWLERLAAKSTMKSERTLVSVSSEEDSDEGSIELF
jgi:methyl-accepting chemotaxis protein